MALIEIVRLRQKLPDGVEELIKSLSEDEYLQTVFSIAPVMPPRQME